MTFVLTRLSFFCRSKAKKCECGVFLLRLVCAFDCGSSFRFLPFSLEHHTLTTLYVTGGNRCLAVLCLQCLFRRSLGRAFQMTKMLWVFVCACVAGISGCMSLRSGPTFLLHGVGPGKRLSPFPTNFRPAAAPAPLPPPPPPLHPPPPPPPLPLFIVILTFIIIIIIITIVVVVIIIIFFSPSSSPSSSSSSSWSRSCSFRLSLIQSLRPPRQKFESLRLQWQQLDIQQQRQQQRQQREPTRRSPPWWRFHRFYQLSRGLRRPNQLQIKPNR